MKKRKKSYSVDAVIRFFLQHYHIPTKQDFEKLGKRMDRLEEALKAATVRAKNERKKAGTGGAARKGATRRGRAKVTATEKIIGVMRGSPQGVDVARLKARTGFEDKKIRNIIFRLTRQGIIKRSGRGIYVVQ
jgi:hypothetical protein